MSFLEKIFHNKKEEKVTPKESPIENYNTFKVDLEHNKSLEEIPNKTLIFTNVEAEQVSINKKAKFKYNSQELLVEEVAMTYYYNEGLKSIWTENHYWWFIYGLLFWDIIFMKSEHCVQVSPENPNFDYYYSELINNEMFDMPHDFFKDTFYEDRKDAINSRFEELKKIDISREINNSYVKHYNQRCRAIERWDKYSLDDLLIAPKHLQNEQIISIMKRLIYNFNENRSGLPDLIVYTNNELFFAEVKSKKDTLSKKQIKWHEYLISESKIDVVIFTVNKTERQLNNLKKKYDDKFIL